jgi:hypothetical protein
MKNIGAQALSQQVLEQRERAIFPFVNDVRTLTAALE